MERGKKHFIFPKHFHYMEEKELPTNISVHLSDKNTQRVNMHTYVQR